jgi:hypothetical protein
MSSGGRWWISMGPLGWLLLGWVVLPVMAAWYLILIVVWACQVVASYRAASRG